MLTLQPISAVGEYRLSNNDSTVNVPVVSLMTSALVFGSGALETKINSNGLVFQIQGEDVLELEDGFILKPSLDNQMELGDETHRFLAVRATYFIPTTQGTYLASNVTTDRTFNADSTTTAELADVLGTLIADLRVAGLVL